MRSFIKLSVSPFVVLLFTLLFCARSSADALDWLDGQANGDGSYTAAADPATSFQATSETLRAFTASGATTRAGIPAAREFLAADPTRNTEYLARLITAQATDANSSSLIAELSARQNPLPPFGDGGFGDSAAAPSTVLDTAFALEALALSGQTAAPELAFALGFLLDRQSADGGWSDGVNVSSVYLTALIARAIQPYRNRYALDDALDSAVQFLLSRRAANSMIGTTAETALALLAIAPQIFDAAVYQGTVDALRAVQAVDGSWDASVYTTALAVHALAVVAAATPSDPTLSTVSGLITDAVDGTPLTGAGITLSGADTRSTTTGRDGSYVIENVVPGSVSLRVEQPGYLAVTGANTAEAGRRVNFSAALPRDPQPRPLTLTGRVVNAADSAALPGVTLRVLNSGTTTLSGSDGSFTLAGLAAGSYLIEVSAVNFVTAQLSIAAAAGGTLDLGTIALSSTAGADSGIAGTVIDALTQAPLRGVAITFNGADTGTVYSAIDGRFDQRPVNPGTLTVTASLAGYRAAGVTATLAAGADLGIRIALVQTGNPAEVSVQGRLVDAVTAAPLAGATVRAATDLAQQTGMDGSFVLGGIPAGAFTLQLSQTGYLPVAYSVSAPAGGSVQLGTVQLAPEGPVTDNRPPEITSTAPTLAGTGQPYAYNVLAGDADGDPLSFGLLAPPAGMRIDAGNGQIRWIPTVEQTGSASFSVVVADDRGGVAMEDVTVQVGAGGGRSYVITDIQTLNGLTIDATVPQNYVLGRYVSGALPGVTLSSPPCPLSWVRAGNDVPAAVATLDRLAIQPAQGSDIIMDLEQAYDTITVFPQIDHLPFPQEGIEYTVWGTDNPAASFPDGWTLGTLVSIYTQGWEVDASCNGADETDDYAGLYSFGQQAFRYLRVRTDFSITLFDTPAHVAWQPYADDAGEPGWQSSEGEIDAVGGMLCTVKPVADAGADILGVTGDTITFDAGTSSGTNLRFGWDIDGDNAIDLNGPTPSNVFTAGFDGDVTLYAIDERGCVGTDQVRVTIGLDIPKPDLVIDTLATDGVQTDLFTLQISGSAGVTVRNQGRAPALTAPQVSLFEDLNRNGAFDAGSDNLLGAITLPNGLARDAQITLDVPLSGEVTFRDSPLLAMVDSDLKIDEQREDNNLASTSDTCRVTSTPLDTLDFVEKWYWSGDPRITGLTDIYGPVTVGQLTDDNGDGVIDAADTPDILFSVTRAGSGDGRLVAVDGNTGDTLWVNASVSVTGYGSPALGDIDGDGLVEAVIVSTDRLKLYAFEHDGTLKWTADTGPVFTGTPRDAVALADLDHDGDVEIVHGRRVFDHLGNQLWEGSGDHGGDLTYGTLPIVVDLDMQGDMEVVAGRTAYRADGTIFWQRTDLPSGGGFTAVGNFNNDDFPEVVLVAGGSVYLLDYTGQTLWGPVNLPGGGSGGAPTVGDFDADGEPEIGIAGASNYIVLETDGAIKWTSPTQDASSHRTGSSLFDFNTDGRVEVVYADELFLRVYRGENGEILKQLQLGSGTTLEYPVIADIDGDGRAEIVTGSNSPFSSRKGLFAFEAPADNWAPTRAIWNQHSYHINNVNDDGSIPQFEQPSWLSHNSFRLNTFADRNPALLTDITASVLRVIDNGAGQPATISVRIGNGGASDLSGALTVDFYAGDPASGGTRLGTVSIGALAAGSYRDATLENVTTLSGDADIYALADFDNRWPECNEANNQVVLPVLPQTRSGTIGVATDAPVYGPDSPVQLQAAVTNASAVPGEFRAELRVEDAFGTVIQTYPEQAAGPLDGGATLNLSELWNSATFQAGTYRLHGLLYSLDGVLLDEADTPFEIQHAVGNLPLAALRVTTDLPVYHTSDSAQLNNLVSNLARNTSIKDSLLRVSVSDPSGSEVFSYTQIPGELTSGAQRTYTTAYSFTAAPEGLYTVTGTLTDSAGNLLATDQVQYQVVADLQKDLTGSVAVQSRILERGKTQLCTDTLNNAAGQALTAQPIRQLLVKLDSADVLTSNDSTLTLAPAASDSLVRSIATAGLVEGVYSCVLQAQIAGAWTTLANAQFTLIVPPIDITATLEQADALRLLVLLDSLKVCDSDDESDNDDESDEGESDDDSSDGDCNTATTDTDPDGPANAPLLGEQRTFLENLLTTQGWSYRIVTDAQTFTRELRSGGYTTYALFSEQTELEERVQKELREAVFRGEGLLVTVTEDDQYKALYTALGIKLKDTLPAPTAISVEAVEDITAGRAGFTLIEPVRRITLQGAEAVARYPGMSACSDEDDDDEDDDDEDDDDEEDDDEGDDSDNDDSDDNSDDAPDCSASAIAVTHHRYGDGHSLAAGFDLSAQAAQPAADPLFTDLLSEALAATRPDPALSLLTGSVAALQLTLANQGIATPGQAVITPPADSQTLDPGLATAQADGRLLWPFDLAENASTALTFWLQLPEAVGPATTTALIQVGISPNLTDYDSLQLSLDPNPRPGLGDILDTLTALAAQDETYADALEEVQKAKDALDQGQADKALKAALKAADALISLDQSQATTVRHQLALAISLIERQL
ncbi:MAG: hypothetical protein BMS9Abin06_0665 [Gammaproteobacteria bacterium]|nr:MAG: hypothetical protein BMS9Abin06_0665 [Gammaproteobacteria bacterium]